MVFSKIKKYLYIFLQDSLLFQDSVFLGAKLLYHDSSFSVINNKKKDIFAISSERCTRFKHDKVNIYDPLIDLGFSKSLLNHSFLPADITNKKYIYFFDYFYLYLLPNIRFRLGLKPGYLQPSLSGVMIKLFLSYPISGMHIFFQSLFGFYYRKVSKSIKYFSHHQCHAFPAYYFSPFSNEECLVFVLDGLGEFEHSSLWHFSKNGGELLAKSSSEAIRNNFFFKKSTIFNFAGVGLLYSCFTDVLGFTPNSDEGKVEALAAYGSFDNVLYQLCKEAYFVDSEKITLSHNLECVQKIQSEPFLKTELLRIGKENMAATIQLFLENIVVEYLNLVYLKYGIKNLCLAGGVAANVIMNLAIYEKTPFQQLYILPFMGDEGTSFGPAIINGLSSGLDLSWLNQNKMPYWGPEYSRHDIISALSQYNDKLFWEDSYFDWPEKAADLISKGYIVAVFNGRMEFGPRALGNRSILANPSDPLIREKMNLTIKKRPYFQPFCPSILESEREKLFESSYSNKHMTMAFRLKQKYRTILPSACHIDGTARPQFVEKKDNPDYYRILLELKKITGYGVVVNTSFNLHGRAMVMSPEDACQDFLDCNLDVLFMGGFLIRRK